MTRAKQWYLGRTHTNGLLPFKSDIAPTKESHSQFRQVVGPYSTRRAAVMAAAFGYRNPQFGYVPQYAKATGG